MIAETEGFFEAKDKKGVEMLEIGWADCITEGMYVDE